MNGAPVDFVAGTGTAYVGMHSLALHVGPVDAAFAAVLIESAEIEPVAAYAQSWTDLAIIVVEPGVPRVEIACRGAVTIDADGVLIEGTADWHRRTIDVDPHHPVSVSARIDVDAGAPTHRTEAGIVPASAVSWTFGPSIVPAADPFDELFGHTRARTVEAASVRVDDARARKRRQPLGVLVFSTGERIVIDKPTVLGRNPQAPVDLAGDELDPPRLVKVANPGVSRQHAIVRLDRWHVTIDDLGSSNGTRITLPGRGPIVVVPGTPTDLVTGARVDLGGDVSFVVEEVA